MRRREFPAITRLTPIGRLLIALRIAQGLTHRELAARLGISESLVSRGERNEDHRITVERAQRIVHRRWGPAEVSSARGRTPIILRQRVKVRYSRGGSHVRIP